VAKAQVDWIGNLHLEKDVGRLLQLYFSYFPFWKNQVEEEGGVVHKNFSGQTRGKRLSLGRRGEEGGIKGKKGEFRSVAAFRSNNSSLVEEEIQAKVSGMDQKYRRKIRGQSLPHGWRKKQRTEGSAPQERRGEGKRKRI